MVSWSQGSRSQSGVFPTSQKGFQPTLRDTSYSLEAETNIMLIWASQADICA